MHWEQDLLVISEAKDWKTLQREPQQYPRGTFRGKKKKFSTVLLLVYKSCADLRKVCHVFLSFFISLARTTSSRHCFLKENSRWNKARSRNGDLDSGFGEGLSEDWKAARGLGRSPGTNDRFMKRHSI